MCFLWLGNINNSLGDTGKALDYFAQSLRLFRAVGNKSSEANTLENIGVVYSDLGEKQQALKYFNESWLLSPAVGDKRGEASTLANTSVVYDDLYEQHFMSQTTAYAIVVVVGLLPLPFGL